MARKFDFAIDAHIFIFVQYIKHKVMIVNKIID